jgi:predicted PurR-regulated permease PerM
MAKRSSRKKTGSASSTRQRPGGVADESSSSKTRAQGKGDEHAVPESADRGDIASTLARLHIWQIQAVRDVLIVAAALALFWAGYALRAVTVPLLVALLLAYLFEPLIRQLCHRRRMSRAGAVLTLLIAVGGAFIIVLALSLPLVVGQSIQFIDDIKNGVMRQRVEKLERWVPAGMRDEFDRLVDQLPGGALIESEARRLAPPEETEPAVEAGEPDAPPHADSPAETTDPAQEHRLQQLLAQRMDEELEPIRAELSQLRDRLDAGAAAGERTGGIWELLKRGFGTVMTIVGSLIGLGLLAFLIPFYFFFFSLWYPEVLKFGESLLPAKNKPRVLDLLAKMDAVVAGFVRGRIVISIIMGILLAIGWMICGVPYAIPLGLIVGVFCAVPYLGGVGIPLAVALLLFDQLGLPAAERTLWLGWFGVLLWPTLVFGIIQTIEGYVLTPVIAGKATKLDPVTIVVVVLAGGSVMGVYGMLLAIPVAACGKILFMEVLLPKILAWTRGEIADPLPIERE